MFARLSSFLKAGTPIFCNTPANNTPTHRQAKTPAISWITASARHGFCVSIILA